MKLRLYRSQIVEDIGVVKFEVINYQRFWLVVHELRALVEKGRIIFICLDNKGT